MEENGNDNKRFFWVHLGSPPPNKLFLSLTSHVLSMVLPPSSSTQSQSIQQHQPIKQELEETLGCSISDEWWEACCQAVQESQQQSLPTHPQSSTPRTSQPIDRFLTHLLHSDLRDVVSSDTSATSRRNENNSRQTTTTRIIGPTQPSCPKVELQNVRCLLQIEDWVDVSLGMETRILQENNSNQNTVNNNNNNHSNNNHHRTGMTQSSSSSSCLKLILTNGQIPTIVPSTSLTNIILAMEVTPMGGRQQQHHRQTHHLHHPSMITAGCKVLIHGHVIIRYGILQLHAGNSTLLGGQVLESVEKRRNIIEQIQKDGMVGIDPTIRALIGNQAEEDDNDHEENDVRNNDDDDDEQQQRHDRNQRNTIARREVVIPRLPVPTRPPLTEQQPQHQHHPPLIPSISTRGPHTVTPYSTTNMSRRTIDGSTANTINNNNGTIWSPPPAVALHRETAPPSTLIPPPSSSPPSTTSSSSTSLFNPTAHPPSMVHRRTMGPTSSSGSQTTAAAPDVTMATTTTMNPYQSRTMRLQPPPTATSSSVPTNTTISTTTTASSSENRIPIPFSLAPAPIATGQQQVWEASPPKGAAPSTACNPYAATSTGTTTGTTTVPLQATRTIPTQSNASSGATNTTTTSQHPQTISFADLYTLLQRIMVQPNASSLPSSLPSTSWLVDMKQLGTSIHFNIGKEKIGKKNKVYHFEMHATFGLPSNSSSSTTSINNTTTPVIACQIPSHCIEPYFERSPVELRALSRRDKVTSQGMTHRGGERVKQVFLDPIRTWRATLLIRSNHNGNNATINAGTSVRWDDIMAPILSIEPVD